MLLYCLPFRCEPGFSGPACEMASQTYPVFISESFTSSRLSSYHNFYSIRGAEVSFGCGVLASGKALIFNKDGRRQLITTFLDSSQSRSVIVFVLGVPELLWIMPLIFLKDIIMSNNCCAFVNDGTVDVT